MSRTLTEVFLAGESKAEEKDGLVWRPIMRTGEWKVHPNGKGTPLKIVKEDAGQGEVALSDIKNAFDEAAIEHVTIPLSIAKDRNSHDDLAIDNTGYVRKVEIVDGSDGISRLVAGHEFTESDVKQKVINGSIAGNSAGLLFNYQRKSDGKTFPVAMAHSALTNRPWLDGLGNPLGIAASDEIDVIETLEPVVEEEIEKQTETEVETEATGFKKYIEAIDKQFKSLAESWKKRPEESASTEGGSAVPPVQNKDDLKTTTTSIPVQRNTDPLREAQQQRRQTLMSQERTRQSTTNGGNSMTVDISKLELSDEAKTAFEDQQSRLTETANELAELRAAARKSKVESRIAELKNMGLEQHPGLLKVIKDIYLSDDEQPALNLSEEGSSTKVAVTASEIVDRMIDALPKKEDKIVLSQQVTEESKDKKPPADTEEEVSLEDRLAATREFLEIPDPAKK